MSDRRRRLSLVKGRHRFVFQYREGNESQLVGSFVDLARDPESEFDWFDAAVLSYQMGREAAESLCACDSDSQEMEVYGTDARGTWIPG